MIQSSVSNSINEILVSTVPTFFLFYNEKKKKKSIPSPLFTIAVIGKVFAILFDVHRTLSRAYGHQKLDKPHRYIGQIQQQFSNHFEQCMSTCTYLQLHNQYCN